MTVIGIAVPGYKYFETVREEKEFFDFLVHDIYYAQSECYRHQKATAVLFRRDLHSYDITGDVYETLGSRKMPDSVLLKKTSNIQGVSFWSNCSVRESGTLRFETSRGEVTLVVYLGKGRVVLSGG